MSSKPIVSNGRQLPALIVGHVPRLFVDVGEQSFRRFIEFFTANIRNRNTREAYASAVRHFADWCERHKLKLGQLSPPLIAAYIEQLGTTHSVPTVSSTWLQCG